jgi:hypothetical protein
MKKISLLFILFIFSTGIASAQQWTEEQKEIWRTVQYYSSLYNSNNMGEFYNYFDNSYWAWNYDGAALLNKDKRSKEMNYWAPYAKENSYFITPFKIRINGNFAYADFIYKKISDSKNGKIISDVGHYTDLLMKINGKWLIVSDHGDDANWGN